MPVSWGENTVYLIEKIGTHKQAPRFGTPDKLPQKVYDHQGNLVEEQAKSKVRPSLIILGTIPVLIGLQEFAGLSIPFGGSASADSPPPYQGDCFREGSQHFTKVAELVALADPQDWGGESSEDYDANKKTLKEQAETMARLDLEMEKLVKDHSERVRKTQLGIGIEQDILILGLAIVVVLG